jgi:hypothetical protein
LRSGLAAAVSSSFRHGGGIGIRGQYDDGNLKRVRIAFERAHGAVPVEDWHVEIHNDQIGTMLARRQQGLASIGGSDHLESLAFQAPYQHVTAELVVFG